MYNCIESRDSRKATPAEALLLGRAIKDAKAIRDAGEWEQAKKRVQLALRDYRARVAQRSIGAPLAIQALSREISSLVGIDRATVFALANEVLLDCPLLTVARELAAIRRELREATS